MKARLHSYKNVNEVAVFRLLLDPDSAVDGRGVQLLPCRNICRIENIIQY